MHDGFEQDVMVLKYLFVYHVLNMKTNTISDETYRMLESVKAGRSFSATIEGLIAGGVSTRIDRLIDLGSRSTGREAELAKVVGEIRKRTKARTA